MHYVSAKLSSDSGLQQSVTFSLEKIGLSINLQKSWKTGHRRLVLVTGHRRENFGKGLQNICDAIRSLSKKYREVDFIYPVHLNPNVQKPVNEQLSGIHNVYLIKPLDYLPFIYLIMNAYFILTDSGGVQEEAPGLGKPVLVMCYMTERPEVLKAGTAKLVGTDKDMIIDHVTALLTDSKMYDSMSTANNPYGDGHSSQRIVSILESEL